jgi:PTH2 family peptidyl-tRNA hydrolase
MEDIKQIIVMRSDLGMRKGKMIAQGAHASMMFLTKRLEDMDGDADVVDRSFGLVLTPEEIMWVKGSFKKICVYVKDEAQLLEVFEAAKKAEIEVNLVTDSGLTEFKGVPTNTCIAIGPDRAEKIDQITGNLPLL